MLKQWCPQFVPEDATMNSLITWIRIEGLPLEYYQDDVLYPIVSQIGSPIRVDRQTAMVTRGKFARVCVEIELSKPLPPDVGVDGAWLKVVYEGIPSICRYCWHAGHTTETCHLKAAVEAMEDDQRTALVSVEVNNTPRGT
ncbi:hypothetical protein LINGRAHAP2_LOCUS10451 [Linum grandiflorum]